MKTPDARTSFVNGLEFQTISVFRGLYVTALKMRYPKTLLDTPIKITFKDNDLSHNTVIAEFIKYHEEVNSSCLSLKQPADIFEKADIFLREICRWHHMGRYKKTTLSRKISRARKEFIQIVKKVDRSYNKRGSRLDQKNALQGFRAYTAGAKKQIILGF